MEILIWLGSGFAFAVGVWVGAALVRSVYKRDKSQIDGEREARELLKERNKIGWEQVASLDRIAEVIELKGQ